MYTREIQVPRDTPVENGIPVPGTWNKAFSQVNLLDIHRPYPFPLPRWLKDFRIKEWESFSIQEDHLILEAVLGNFKLFQIAQVFLYNKETGENYHFRKIIPGNRVRMPENLNNVLVEYRSPSFLFRVHPCLNADTIMLDIDVAETKRQPAFSVHLTYCLGEYPVTPMAVSLNFAERAQGRLSMYAFKTLSAIKGVLLLGERRINLEPARCTGIFCDYKGFFPYHMTGSFCAGTGFDEEGRRYGFHIVENQAKDTHKNNENVLWVNGHFTPLPPVRITMPNGPESDWVIQDLDGMVDLVFTPKKNNRFGANLLLMRGDFFALMGYYNGVLVNSKDEKIQVHNQWGIGEKLYLRV